MTSCYYGHKIPGSQQSFLTETAFALSSDERKVWATFCSWVQSCTGKSFFCLFLPYYLQDQGLLRSRYFATMAIWCNNFSSPYSHPIIGDSFQFWSSLYSDHPKKPSSTHASSVPWLFWIIITKTENESSHRTQFDVGLGNHALHRLT